MGSEKIVSFKKCVKNRSFMKNKSHPPGYWIKQRCVEDSQKYITRTEWYKNSSSAYAAAQRNGRQKHAGGFTFKYL